jgi:hypothetical protein
MRASVFSPAPAPAGEAVMSPPIRRTQQLSPMSATAKRCFTFLLSFCISLRSHLLRSAFSLYNLFFYLRFFFRLSSSLSALNELCAYCSTKYLLVIL